ncbi:damaged DNA binding protein 1A [Hibiscus trionum]|uniref:DNA damage-binding protein 1 n=1 Tax=Hibiscus trionum TaxID=183268 RepID=A0A9W7IHX7_HIBTR|nr:damaged DNA binding protein 1A [Hibiscus trionum]
MRAWNYVVMAHKPTKVSHSCVGNFTGPQKLNLIVAKNTHFEISFITHEGLEPFLDVPIFGRIAALELFRPRGETQDFLFVSTELYEFFVLQWDAEKSVLLRRGKGTASGYISSLRFVNSGMSSIIDPDCRLIGLNLYNRFLEVIRLDDERQLRADRRYDAFHIRYSSLLFSNSGVERSAGKVCLEDVISLGGVEINSEDIEGITGEYTCGILSATYPEERIVEEAWFQNDLDNGANFLIPVPPPLCGVIIVGEETIVYYSANTSKTIPIGHSITEAYGRVDADGSRYLLSDRAGLLRLLVITHEKEKVTGLEIQLLGETSIASTISYLDNAIVFIGSSSGDSQLIKLNPQPDAKGSFVEVLDTYVNLGPIIDFCVVDHGRQGQCQVVTCSGADKDSSLRIVQNEIGINEQASVELQGIKAMWSLRSSTDDSFDTFLVVSFISETRIFAMNLEELEETEIDGFNSQVQTLFCHDAVYNQLVQVTSSSVRLVSSISRELQDEWNPLSGYSINVATANATQVLVATGGGHLVYLEIDDGKLTQVKHEQLEYEISCLDINPIGENSNSSQLAAVGMWTDISVRIFSLPHLNLIAKEQLEGEIISRSVLLCTFEGISYLLCALGDGHLLNFQLNINGEFTDRKKVSLGTQPIRLGTFSSKNSTRVFAASDRATVIYSRNKKLLYTNVNLEGVGHICPFNTAAFPDSLAIAKQGELTIGTIDHFRKLHNIRTIPLGEHAHRICHQEQSHTCAILSLKNQSSADESEMHFIRLLGDQTFEFISTYALDTSERGCSILSCSFSDDTDTYYCVGTRYDLSKEDTARKVLACCGRPLLPSRGRIMVFVVEDGKLQLIAEKETKGAVYSLNAFSGKLLAYVNENIELYKWMLREDGTRELLLECDDNNGLWIYRHKKCVYGGDKIVFVADTDDFIFRPVFFRDKEQAIGNQISDVEILDDAICLGADMECNLFTVRHRSVKVDARYRLAFDIHRSAELEQSHIKKSIKAERSIEMDGEYHLGEFVNRFRHGSLMGSLDSDVGQIPTVIFGTSHGAIGVVASIPHEQYIFLKKLQSSLVKVKSPDVGGLCHQNWRTGKINGRIQVLGNHTAINFLDGDLIELFLDLSRGEMEEISKEVNVSVEELSKRVEELTRLHCEF